TLLILLSYVHSYLFLSYYFILFIFSSFFFNAPSTTEIYTLSLHDALPISSNCGAAAKPALNGARAIRASEGSSPSYMLSTSVVRSEEHTSELQSLAYLVCRLLLEKKKKKNKKIKNKNTLIK